MASLKTKYQKYLNYDDQYWKEFFSIDESLRNYFLDLKGYFSSLDFSQKEEYVSRLDELRTRTHQIKPEIYSLMPDNNEDDLIIGFTDMHYCLNKTRTHLYKLTIELSLIFEKSNSYLKGMS